RCSGRDGRDRYRWLLWSLGRLGVRVAACSACRSETYACEGSSSATYLIDPRLGFPKGAQASLPPDPDGVLYLIRNSSRNGSVRPLSRRGRGDLTPVSSGW